MSDNKNKNPIPGDSTETSDANLQEVHGALLREKDEPAARHTSPPMFVLLLLAVLVFCCGIYLQRYSGNFDPMVYNEETTGGAPVAQTLAPPTPAQLGKKVYLTNCVTCHQTTGLGMPGMYPPLAGSDWVAGSEERIIRIVLHGATGPIKVNGVDFNNTMTPFKDILKDKDIANVLTFIRSEWGNNAPAVTPEKVAEIRQLTASRTTSWTAAELLEIK